MISPLQGQFHLWFAKALDAKRSMLRYLILYPRVIFFEDHEFERGLRLSAVSTQWYYLLCYRTCNEIVLSFHFDLSSLYFVSHDSAVSS